MDHTTTTRTRPRARLLLRLAVVGVIALVLAALQPGVAGARGWYGTTIVVHPGQSIQTAVDNAPAGATIKLDAGTWTEAVCIKNKGLTIVGAGRDQTVITWPAWNSLAQLRAVPAALINPGAACWQAWEASDLDDNGGGATLADDVSGLFFLNPTGPVTVANLTTKNHPSNGIIGWGANGFSVSGTSGEAHERYGILAAASRNVKINGNVEKAGRLRPAPYFAGTAGISLGDSKDAQALITNNQVQGYNLGVFIRESSGGMASGNYVTGNCVGILLFDDSATEIPNVNGHIEGGNFTLSTNTSVANNRYCIAGRDGSQRVSGVGMAVVNAAQVKVVSNTIRDNHFVVPAGQAPLTFPPGGLILLSLAPPPDVNNVVDPGLVSYVTVTTNTIQHNFPVDIWLTRAVPGTPLRAPGPGISITNNFCGVSDPSGFCRQS
jgi:parallel beta-helix repeat protein